MKSTAPQLVILAKAINNIELIELTNDLRLEVATIKGTLAEAIDENRRLKTQLNKKDAGDPECRDGLYWFGEDGPYCTGCFDKSRSKIRLSKMPSNFSTFGKWRCPSCRAHFQGAD